MATLGEIKSQWKSAVSRLLPHQAPELEKAIQDSLQRRLDAGEVETDTLFEVIEEVLAPLSLDSQAKSRLRRALDEVALGYSPYNLGPDTMLGPGWDSGESLAAALFALVGSEVPTERAWNEDGNKESGETERVKAATQSESDPTHSGMSWRVRNNKGDTGIRSSLLKLQEAEKVCALLRRQAAEAALVAVTTLHIPQYWLA